MINGNVSIKNNTITTAKQQRNSVVYFAEDVLNQGKAILINGKYYGGSQLIETTYKQLRYLKDISSLIPGASYRITDYVTTTVQSETRSAGHQFDVIVTAISENEFNENAKVCKHEGDTYFQNCDLNAWEIKYSIYNDVDRFEWADYYPKNIVSTTTTATASPTNTETTSTTLAPGYVINEEGKGVIYYMKDEFKNEAWYDFKNIQFLRTADFFNTNSFLSHLDGDNYYYTFSKVYNDKIIDISIYNESNTYAINNRIGVRGQIKRKLTDIIFINSNGVTRNNIIGDSSYSCTFGDTCHDNVIADYCYNNVIGNDFKNNHIKQLFTNNKVTGTFQYNTLGIQCYNNNFSGYIWFTTFGSQFNYCSFNIPEGSILEYCDFGSGIGFLNGIPAIRKVKFENNVAWYNSTTYVSNLQTIDGRTLADAITIEHDSELYVSKVGDKYSVQSILNNNEVSADLILTSNTPTANDNANHYGYVGTLQNLGVNGDIIIIDTITSYVRTGSASTGLNTAVWCRLLKFVNNTWKLVYQSVDNKKIKDYEANNPFSFKMKKISDDIIKYNDKIAIVYSSTDDVTDIFASTQLGLRAVTNKTGGLNNALTDNSTGASNYQTVLTLKYISISDTPSTANTVTIEDNQTITGTKQFNGGISIAGKSFITSAINPGELKVLRSNNKGFIVRTADGSDNILPLQILSTNGFDSYQYDFPSKGGTVVLDNDLDTINSRLDDFIAETNNGNESLLLIIRDLVSRIEALENK